MGKPIDCNNMKLYNAVVNKLTYQAAEISLLRTHPR